ncbi:hypothetical protein [Streptomyces mexicanus]|uniref:hypothetical protein n=1 Tax=Streptomyces mexicanus TaxID=178566 RepID=UPI003663E091
MTTPPSARRNLERLAADASARGVLIHPSAIREALAVEEQPVPDPLAYGPTGYRCGCGKDAHSNLTPCATDEPATTATAALYEAMRRIADAPQDYELDPGRGDARAIIRNLLAEVEAQPEPPADAHARRLAALAGTDPLAYVLVRPGEDDTANIDAGSRGMSRAVAAYMLRQVADRFDVQARAEGDEPIPYGPTANDEEESAADAARRFARRLAAVERLCASRPGYHSITVKALLTAMNDADDQADEHAEAQQAAPLSEAMRAVGRMASEGFARGIAQAEARTAEAQQ